MKSKKHFLLMAIMFGTLLGFYSNCAQNGYRTLSSHLGVADLDPVLTTTSDTDAAQDPHAVGDYYVPNGGRVAISNYSQTLASMLSVTGLGTFPMPIGNSDSPLVVARDTMETYKNMFSTEGEVERITAPMLLAYITISNAVCQGAIRAEIERAAGDRIFFIAVDVNPNSNPNSTLAQDKASPVIRRMARAFWGRNETDVERQIILSNLKEMNAEAVASSGQPNLSAMVWLCSSMLASVSSIAN